MRLFLSGGGSDEQSAVLDKKFSLNVDKSKLILYLPIAIDKVKHPFPSCLKWISDNFKPYGLNKIELWDEKDLRERPESDLKRFGGVYIGGGNTFYLLKELKESGFIVKLEKLIDRDVPVYGGSAGAIIHGKSVIPALSADANDVGIEDFSAMDLVKGYDLWCHYTPDMERDIHDYRKKYGLKLIALPENSGLYVTEKEIEVIGNSAYLVKDKLIEIKPKEKIIS